MKQLIPLVFLFIAFGPCRANSHSYTFNYENLITVQIIVLDTPPPGTVPGNAADARAGLIRGKQCYDNKTGRQVTGVFAALFSPLGLLLAIVISASPPDPYNTGCVEEHDLNNLSYLRGFRKGLHREKANMVWGGFLNGWAAGIAIAVLLIAISGGA